MTTKDWTREREQLRSAYRNFNARNLEQVLAALHLDVQWANGMEGGHVFGRDAVREYWTRQWAVLDPHVEPIAIEPDDKGRMVVEVHQLVRDLKGTLLVDTTVHHAYQFADGFIQRMDIE